MIKVILTQIQKWKSEIDLISGDGKVWGHLKRFSINYLSPEYKIKGELNLKEKYKDFSDKIRKLLPEIKFKIQKYHYVISNIIVIDLYGDYYKFYEVSNVEPQKSDTFNISRGQSSQSNYKPTKRGSNWL